MLDHAATRAEVVEVSLGDYVLNGGEVAAVAITEAVVRLLPGFMGNAESLVEESHEDGLLEYPVYTRPASWRGLDVPPVLLSGDHAAVAAWRLDEARRRTAQRRPDLLHPSLAATEWEIVPAQPGDAGELLTLQRACWVQEALANDSLADIPALHESLEDVLAWMRTWSTWVVRSEGRLVGAVRGRLEDTPGGQAWDIGRIMVAPDLQGRGLGRALLAHIEAVAAPEATSYLLFTGARSADNIRMYRKAGYRVRTDLEAPPLAVILTKRRPRELGPERRLRRSAPLAAVADSLAWPSRLEGRSLAQQTAEVLRRVPADRGGPAPPARPPTGASGAANLKRSNNSMNTSDSAADLWHSRGAAQ